MIKKILIAISFIMLVIGFYISYDFLCNLASFLLRNPYWLLILFVAIAVQLFGHFFRAKRTKLILDQAASSSVKFQFATLSTGYLFNAILPFRLGEFIRALLIAKRLRISFLYTITSVVIERAIDIIFLSILVILCNIAFRGQLSGGIIAVAFFAFVVAILILFFVVLLKQENKHLLSFIGWVSQLFNKPINNSIRFKSWSLIFGLQKFLNDSKLVNRYVMYAILSWLCYFVSALIIAIPFLRISGILQLLSTSVSPYLISASSVNSLNADSYRQLVLLLPSWFNDINLSVYIDVLWAVLVLPMALIGVISLLLYRVKPNHKALETYPDAFSNKLLRHKDISQEFPAFLDTYFKGSSLSHILHKIELTGELSLVKFFKGGSDAITVLALKDDKLFVKKIVPIEYESRLKVQYNWLKKFKSKRSIVDILAEHKAKDYYAIDISYDPLNVSLFEYIHTHSLEQSKKVIDDTWKYVFKNIYNLSKESVNEAERDEYFEDRLMNKVKKAVSISDELKDVVGFKTIKINGEEYDNFYTIIDKIKSDKKAWADIATYRKSTVTHGDLTVDNILVNIKTDKPYIIDPSDDNQIRGPIIDFARHAQSLIVGYEFLNNDEKPTEAEIKGNKASISYHDYRSARYMQLDKYFFSELVPKYLTESEQRTLLFHTGLLYGRMLAHRVFINPGNTLKYYAVCIVLLNKFYKQYK